MMRVKIYSGISLQELDVKKVLPFADFSPPIRRGQIQQDIRDGYHVLGIIDGLFFQNLAVSPAEIMDGLRFGMKIFGASSMGALRAAELSDYGMVGIGRVFEKIKSSDYFQDDFLGQVFLGDSEGSATTPYIDILIATEKLLLKKQISLKEHNTLIRHFKQKHFSEIDLNSPISGIAKPTIAKLKRTLGVKKSDGLQLIKEINHYCTTVNSFAAGQRAGRAE